MGLSVCMFDYGYKMKTKFKANPMLYALVDINEVPKIVSKYENFLDAITARDEIYQNRNLVIFRLIGENGIQQLSGDELQQSLRSQEKMRQKMIALKNKKKNPESSIAV